MAVVFVNEDIVWSNSQTYRAINWEGNSELAHSFGFRGVAADMPGAQTRMRPSGSFGGVSGAQRDRSTC